MASSGGRGPAEPDSGEQSRRNIINQHFYGPVNQIQRADNCNFGLNNGNIIQNRVARASSQFSYGVREPEPQRQDAVILAGHDVFALLNPILDASHTRDLRIAPPNSQCIPGTRQGVMKIIRSWANSSQVLGSNPHIMWIYGYAGCGKSAIAQEVAQYFDRKGRLAAAFFFFRGSGDRSKVARFANTVAHQVAIAIPATAPFIEDALKANPSLATSHTSLSAQFERLVYGPIDRVKWDRLAACLRHGPFIIVLDGPDECEDRKEFATFIENMIQFFNRKPHIPLRFLITSRVEGHIHQQLHSSNQVRLLDLVDHTSDSDIAAALDAAFEKERRSRLLLSSKDWPSQEDKAKLVKHIGGSYIFMTTILRLLFDPNLNDGLTPMERLPLVLRKNPDFDSLYRTILSPWQHLPHFRDIVSTIAIAMEPLSVVQIAELLEIGTVSVVRVLVNLHSILQIPGDDNTPVTVWHTSLRDFLCTDDRSESLSASVAHRRRLAFRCLYVATASVNATDSPVSRYSRSYAVKHLAELVETTDFDALSDDELHRVVMLLDTPAYEYGGNQTALEVACRGRHWKLVRTLINVGVNMNIGFHKPVSGIACALHAACHYKEWKTVALLLEKGADPNIVSPNEGGRVVAGVRGQTTVMDGNGFKDGTALAFAARRMDVKLATRLLECAADPNLQGGYWGTALCAACTSNALELVTLLLEHGADPNLRSICNDQSPLDICARRGYDGCAQALLTFKADPNTQDKLGETPLHRACIWGHVKIVEQLLESNADASVRNSEGVTAMQIAHMYKKQPVVQVFYRHGIVQSIPQRPAGVNGYGV